MPIGVILLIITAVLVYFGVAQRILDRMRLNDRTALLFIITMIAGSFLPDIPIGGGLSINIGGGIIPVALAVYLIVTADEASEKNRAIIASIITGAVIYATGRFLTGEPETIFIDPIYMFGLLAGLVAYLIGRSRRGAFAAGILGVVVSDIAYAIENSITNTPGRTAIGGSGIFDTVVVAGLIAVVLAEIVGEAREKLQGGTSKAKLKRKKKGKTTFTSLLMDDKTSREGDGNDKMD